jgi:pectin methylesterase-like acyl-CoA thioesterase
MIKLRFLPLAAALVATISLTACKTAPMMPMGSAAAAPGMAKHDHMAMMDAQMKTMQGMHDKMMAAKTPEESTKLMDEHMKSMQSMMQMMKDQMPAK